MSNHTVPDAEQIDADFWFSKIRGALRMEILWADAADVPTPYQVVFSACGLSRRKCENLIEAGVPCQCRDR